MSKQNEKGQPKIFEGLSTRELSAELNALTLGHSDEDSDEASYDPMNISDFLNSRGELTGISEWTDSDNDEKLENILKEHLNEDIGSDASSASTESITVSMRQDSAPAPIQNNHNSTSDVKNKEGEGVPESDDTNSGTKYPFPNYGCRVFSGFELNNASTNASSWRVLPGTETEQIFIRAPNFRTPGGYKPPLVEKEPRDLTDDQIFQEVKEMYEEGKDGKTTPDDKDSSSNNTDTKDNVDGDGNKRKDTAQKVPVEEPIFVKSKTWLCGDGQGQQSVDKDAFAEIFTESYKGDISRCLPRNRLPPHARKENLEELTRLWNEIQDTKQRLEHDMSSLVTPPLSDTGSQSQRLYFESNEVSHSHMKTSSPKSQSSRNPDSFPKLSPIPRRNVSFGKRPLASDVESVKVSSADGDRDQNPKDFNSEVNKSSSKARPKRTARKVKSKQRIEKVQQVPPPTASGADVAISQLPFLGPGLGFDKSEVDQILHETDMQESDLDEILSEISNAPAVPVDLFNDPESPYELSTALQELQISDWAKEGAQEYMQKYYEERYRRDFCEAEILNLQKQLLECKEKFAITDGVLRGKEATIVKFTKLWEGLLAQWKSHENGCKALTAQLQSGNMQLKSELDQSKSRIKEYESELEKSIDVSGSFKSKIEALLDELESQKEEATNTKQDLDLKISSLETLLAEAKADKESSFRALRDCQESLDVTKKSLTETMDNCKILQVSQKEQEKKISEIREENEKLKTSVQEFRVEKSDFLSKISSLQNEIEKLMKEKVILESTQESENRRFMNEERQKLHDYYNDRIQIMLRTESQKMIRAEKEFVALHDKKLEKMIVESESQIEEMKMKFSNQLSLMKQKYESEINTLKKENEEQFQVIGAVSRQIRSFSERDLDKEGSQKKSLTNNTSNSSVESDNTNRGRGALADLVEALTGQRRMAANSPQEQTNGNNNGQYF